MKDKTIIINILALRQLQQLLIDLIHVSKPLLYRLGIQDIKHSFSQPGFFWDRGVRKPRLM